MVLDGTMRFERTHSFKADVRRLSDAEFAKFSDAARRFSEACDRFVGPDRTPFPASLRVKSVQGAEGVFEMTWSFSDPDGRATFEWTTVQVVGSSGVIDHEPAVRWRRVGTHRIFDEP